MGSLKSHAKGCSMKDLTTSAPAPNRSTSIRAHTSLMFLFAATALVACGGSGGDSPPAPSPGPAPTQVTVSGTAQFQSVPPTANGNLNYNNQSFKPIRGATVQLLNSANDAVLATSFTSATGAYSFPAVNNPGAVRVRVRAELSSSVAGGVATDISVKDNTSSDALYVLDSTAVSPTTATQTIDLQAASGWGGTSYSAPRSAGPFAVLDTIFQGVQTVRSAVPSQALPRLQVFWSTRNVADSGNNTAADLAAGRIGTSFFSFNGTDFRIYLLGAENSDTDEYDSSVVAHEWGHYLQSAVSRDDSVGGPHTGNDKLDMRVAFSEGFGNAFAGMVLNNPRYTDSLGAAQGRGFFIDVSDPNFSNKGWFSEGSVQHLLWVWSQNASIGFNGLYGTLTGPMKTSGALVGIHHFAQRLKDSLAAAASTITTALQGQNITVQDIWGTGEANTGAAAGSLPLYTTFSNPTRVCVSDEVGAPNKLRNYAYLRFTTPARTATITVQADGITGTDPDFELVNANGVTTTAESEVANSETASIALPAGEHSLVIEDFSLTADDASQGQRCFNVTVN
jgi:hypothetical protein